MQINLLFKDGTELIYKDDTVASVSASKLLFELLYYGNIDDANIFTIVPYTNMKKDLFVQLYIQKNLLVLYQSHTDLYKQCNPLTYEDSDVILDPTIRYYVDGFYIDRKLCIATLPNGTRCQMYINSSDNNVCCIDHRRTGNIDITLNYYELMRIYNDEYLHKILNVSLLIKNFISEQKNDPISIITMTLEFFKTIIYYVFIDPLNSKNERLVNKVYRHIKKQIYTMAYTIIHSVDYIPILCNRPNNFRQINNLEEPTHFKEIDMNMCMECCTCMDTFTQSELIICKCRKPHFFCRECVMNYIKSKHNDGLNYTCCPINNKSNIDLRPIYRHLEPDMINNIGISARIDLYATASAKNVNFYVCPFCKIYGIDIDKNLNTINYTTQIKHCKFTFIKLKFIDGYVYPFIIKYDDNTIEINDMLISIDGVNIAGFIESEIINMLCSKDRVIETKHEQICEILTFINKTNTVKTTKHITTVNCKECNKDWCIKCNKKSHNGTCETIQNPEDIPTRVAEIVTDVMIDRCPNCTNAYIKTEGCNLIHCGKCPQSFCHLCKLQIEKRNDREYWHFKGSGSADASASCPLYEQNNSNMIKMRHISTNIQITNLINSNMEYKDIIISELAKHNIIINKRNQGNKIMTFIKYIFKPLFKTTVNVDG